MTQYSTPTPPTRDGQGPRVRTFAALRHRDFRIFWIGLLLSLTGGWMQQLAGPWLVYRLSDSALTLGLMGFLAAIPAAPLSLVAGPLIDRLPRRPLLIATQFALLLPPIGLALLVWSGQVQVWHVVLAEFLRGAVLAIDQPAKQAAIVEMTGKEDVGSAIALWSSAVSVTRIVGPAVAGALVAWVGEGLCFLLNGVSYLALIVALLAIHLPDPLPSARRLSLGRSLMDGWNYLARERLLVAIASLALVAGLFVRPFQTLLPVFARDVLAVGAAGLGFLTAAAGAGAVLGALSAASLQPDRYRPSALVVSLVLPLMTAGFALTRSLVLSCALLLGVGFCIAALETAVNSLALVEIKDQFRGRVISLYTAASMGAPRVGGLQAGWLAGLWGAPAALILGAALSLLYSALLAWFFLRGKVRRIA